MFETGTIVENLRIMDLAFGGDGVARTDDGAVIFIPRAALGDLVTVEITSAHRNFYRGDIIKLQEASQLRETPPCPAYGRCGGCVYQHISYETEINAKRNQFTSVVCRLGHFKEFPAPEVFVASPERYHYRNKLRLEPIVNKTTRTVTNYGFCTQDNKTFIPVSQCLLAKEKINQTIRQAISSDWGLQNAKRSNPYPLTLRETASGDTAFYYGFAPSKLSWLKETLLGQPASVPVGSFWQVNPPVAESMLTHLRGWAEALKLDTLVDAFAGVGTFTMALGDLFRYRVIIESDASAVKAAQFNLEQRNMKARLIAKATESCLGQVLSTVDNKKALVVIDPPRTGCEPEVLRLLEKFAPAAILYVSCNPSTLARDLEKLCHASYTPVKSACFDMFPATAHFESAVLLQKI